MNLRDDLRPIYDWIPAGSRILDLGCGNGELLAVLAGRKECSGYGVEVDIDSTVGAMSRGANVIQIDLEQGLGEFSDNTFDAIVLSQIIQSMQNTETILRNLIRVIKQAVVTFPNFGYWRSRFQIALGGRIPVSERMPYHWCDTPNIYWYTLKDLDLLCARSSVRVLERVVTVGNEWIRHLPNLLGNLMFHRVGQ